MKSAFLSLVFLGLVLTACSPHRTPAAKLINTEASLPAGLPYDPLPWRVINSAIDRQAFTMSTLYGNDPAVDHARTGTAEAYPPGAVLALVTWEQKSDPNWFGANIPGRLKAIEYVSVNAPSGNVPAYAYQRFAGTPWAQSPVAETAGQDRANQILRQRASVMPDGPPTTSATTQN